uniref:Transcriptional factor DELLA N-terminal domain-containing protein n=1 Tax=Quercus lobata TaxID=97700 RepID=A0A7N2R7S2_QUELO
MCWEEEVQQDGGMDKLLAVLGYQVRASDMAKVAQKLELLEDLMGNAQGDGLSHLTTETVYYNPSNLNARESVVTVRETVYLVANVGYHMVSSSSPFSSSTTWVPNKLGGGRESLQICGKDFGYCLHL